MKLRGLSLLPKIWLALSVALTALFAVTGVILQRHAIESTTVSLEEEVKTSSQAYESVWRARAEILGSTASILSSMPNVRSALGTRDRATIRDTARELWQTIADSLKESAFFQVTNPAGEIIASLDDRSPSATPPSWPVVAAVRQQFPKQVTGFFVDKDRLFQLVLTPVYVDSTRGRDLLVVLVAGYPVNHLVAQRLKESTGGSEFLFHSGDRVYASTLNDRATKALLGAQTGADGGLVSDGVVEYSPLLRDLVDLEGKPIGKLGIYRSFEDARQRITQLRRDLVLMWFLAVLAGLGLTYLLARRIVQPVQNLDRAAAELARQNYDYRMPREEVERGDELGRLASTFNDMCDSLRSARIELIRQERISTIGRLASSIVHDLRNPLAAIYGGAEMMVDTDLPPAQNKRLAQNIYQASRRILEMLQDLLNVSRGRTEEPELCRLREVVEAARDAHRPLADAQSVAVKVAVPDDLELPLQRARVERVFLNLVGNALEVMPRGGEIQVRARVSDGNVIIEVEDTGPGISAEIRDQLFQPFVSHGKKNGLGLGLALSRQTVLDHGGDIWAETGDHGGARFTIRLPLKRLTAAA